MNERLAAAAPIVPGDQVLYQNRLVTVISAGHGWVTINLGGTFPSVRRAALHKPFAPCPRDTGLTHGPRYLTVNAAASLIRHTTDWTPDTAQLVVSTLRHHAARHADAAEYIESLIARAALPAA